MFIAVPWYLFFFFIFATGGSFVKDADAEKKKKNSYLKKIRIEKEIFLEIEEKWHRRAFSRRSSATTRSTAAWRF